VIVPLPRAQRPSEENVLPLINIVFLLLIFFMIAGALSATAPFELEPPRTGSAAVTGPPRGGIALAADGRVAIDGERIAIESLVERARAWKRDASDESPLAVRADAGARSRELLAVIEALREAGIERIRLLAVQADAQG
jgi:biopolymer transport protein ExbD